MDFFMTNRPLILNYGQLTPCHRLDMRHSLTNRTCCMTYTDSKSQTEKLGGSTNKTYRFTLLSEFKNYLSSIVKYKI